MEPYRRILCPVDFSEPSYAALDAAADLCGKFGATLYVIHVLRERSGRIDSSDLFGCKTVRDLYTSRCFPHWIRVERTAWAQLEELRTKRLPRNLNLSLNLLTGNAADEILRTAEACDIDLIVMPANSWTGWRRFLFGSVADKVLRLSACPVLLLRDRPSGEPTHQDRASRRVLGTTL